MNWIYSKIPSISQRKFNPWTANCLTDIGSESRLNVLCSVWKWVVVVYVIPSLTDFLWLIGLCCIVLQFCLQKPIFAPEPPASDDLSQFFEECRNPPNLDMFSSGNVMDVSAALVSYSLSQEVTCGEDLNIECGTELELSYSKRQVLAVSSSWYYCIKYVGVFKNICHITAL